MRKLQCALFYLLPLFLLAACKDGVEDKDLKQPASVGLEAFKEGVEYKALKQPIPVLGSANDKITVYTVFWYGCSHCLELAKREQDWKKTLPGDVVFDEIPAIFGDNWLPHAKLFFAMEDLQLPETAHFAVFEAVQHHRRRLDKEEDMADFLSSNGFKVSKEKFIRAYRSEGVKHQTGLAGSIARGALLTGVPAIIVDGRYVIDPKMAEGRENMLKIADYLIEKARGERASTALVSSKNTASSDQTAE